MVLSPKVALFIPCFNADHGIGRVLDSLTPLILEGVGKVIIIDNGSTDNTDQIIRNCLAQRNDPRFEYYRNPKNYSLGGSTIIALQLAIRAGFDFLVCMHGDGQAQSEDLREIVSRARGDVGFVLGSRMLPESRTEDYSRLRLIGNHFFLWLQSLVVGRKLGDVGAFMAFNLNVIKNLPYDSLPHDMGYQALLILVAVKQNPLMSIADVPITWGKVERSNVHVWKYAWVHFWRLMALALGRIPTSGKCQRDFPTQKCGLLV